MSTPSYISSLCLTVHTFPCIPPLQLVDAIPRLPQSLAGRVLAAVTAGGAASGHYVQREAGESIFTEGDPADSLVFLVQGQVLLTEGVPADAVIGESQLLVQLRQALGPSSAVMPIEGAGGGKSGTPEGGGSAKAPRRAAFKRESADEGAVGAEEAKAEVQAEGPTADASSGDEVKSRSPDPTGMLSAGEAGPQAVNKAEQGERVEDPAVEVEDAFVPEPENEDQQSHVPQVLHMGDEEEQGDFQGEADHVHMHGYGHPGGEEYGYRGEEGLDEMDSRRWSAADGSIPDDWASPRSSPHRPYPGVGGRKLPPMIAQGWEIDETEEADVPLPSGGPRHHDSEGGGFGFHHQQYLDDEDIEADEGLQGDAAAAEPLTPMLRTSARGSDFGNELGHPRLMDERENGSKEGGVLVSDGGSPRRQMSIKDKLAPSPIPEAASKSPEPSKDPSKIQASSSSPSSKAAAESGSDKAPIDAAAASPLSADGADGSVVGPRPTGSVAATATPTPPPPATTAAAMPLYTAVAAQLSMHKQQVASGYGRPVFLGEEALQSEGALGLKPQSTFKSQK